MSEDNYRIKEEYQALTKALTVDENSSGVYWNKGRIYTSRFYQLPVYQIALELVRKYSLKRIIDVGCGVATKLAYIQKSEPDREYIGIDQSSAIEYCKKTHNFGDWFVDDFEHPQTDLMHYKSDLVIFSDVIEHLLDPDIVLGFLKRIVNKDGYILISTPDRDLLRGKNCTSSPNQFHIREWNSEEFSQYLESRGFQIIAKYQLPAVGFGFNRMYWKLIKRVLSGQPHRYSQACLLQIRND